MVWKQIPPRWRAHLARQYPHTQSLLLPHTLECRIVTLSFSWFLTALDLYVTPISTLICCAGSIGYGHHLMNKRLELLA